MAQVQLVSYSFVQADVNPIDATKFTTATANVAPKIVSNECVPQQVAGTPSSSYWTGAVGETGGVWPADHYSECTLAADFVASKQFTSIIVRQSAVANTCYLVQCNTGTNTTINKRIAGTTTPIGAAVAHVGAPGDVIRVQVDGTTISLIINGGAAVTRVDTDIAAGSPGFILYTSTGQPLASSSISLFAAGANQAAAPTFVPNGGNISGATTVTITSASGGTIYYTTDGSTPTHSSSSIASGATISVSTTATVKAFDSAATLADSTVASATFTLVTSHAISGNTQIVGVAVNYFDSGFELEDASGSFLQENSLGVLLLESGSSGSVTSDGSANYSIPSLADGTYTIVPLLGGYVFSPLSATEVLSGADITGVNFTALNSAIGSPGFGINNGIVQRICEGVNN